jgi:hypothetical protein
MGVRTPKPPRTRVRAPTRLVLLRSRPVGFFKRVTVANPFRHERNYGPNIGSAKIAENKIEWYFTVIIIDYIDLKKKQAC